MGCMNDVMTDKFVVDSKSHPYLIRIARAYEATATPIPSRKDLMEDNYTKTMPQTTGWLNLKDLCAQVGVRYDPKDEAS